MYLVERIRMPAIKMEIIKTSRNFITEKIKEFCCQTALSIFKLMI